MAEREGFEPSVRCRTPAFQASTFDRSATSPGAHRVMHKLRIRKEKPTVSTVTGSVMTQGLGPVLTGAALIFSYSSMEPS